jgi:hypothetical protein
VDSVFLVCLKVKLLLTDQPQDRWHGARIVQIRDDGGPYLRLIGEAKPQWPFVDVQTFGPGPMVMEKVWDKDLCEAFEYMPPGPWLDLLAETLPEFQWAANLWGELMRNEVIYDNA